MLYTLEDVNAHNRPEDLWIVIDGKVYDVTKYHLNHPGGKMVLRDFAGADATEAFEDIGHSSDARSIMDTLCIGRVGEKREQRGSYYIISIFLLIAAAVCVVIGHRLVGSEHAK